VNHFNFPDWTDFTRGLLPDLQRQRMQRHLDDCEDCRHTAGLLDRLVTACRGMHSAEPSETVMARARGIFPTPATTPKRLARLVATLVYDSLLAPQPVGLRTGVEVAWQSAYQAGDYALDLRIEPEARGSRVALVGQLSLPAVPESLVENVPVFVYAGKRIVAQTFSNRFGEFQMEYQQERAVRFRLRIHVDNGTRSILVPLKKVGNFKIITNRRPSPAANPDARLRPACRKDE